MSPISPDCGFAVVKLFTCSQVSMMIALAGIGLVYFVTGIVVALAAARGKSKSL